jgi:hypothetical protein
VQGVEVMNRNRIQRFQKAVKTHRASIQKSLEHRLEVARAKGDENLIRQLEAEKNYYN